MKTIYYRWAILAVLYPYIVGFSPSDTSSTEIEFAVGEGSYADVRRDCQGNVVSVKDVPFREGGISIEHKFSVVKVGIAGGITNGFRKQLAGTRSWTFGDARDESAKGKTVGYMNPKIGLNTKYFGIDAGYFLVLDHEPNEIGRFPNGMLRIGNLDSWYFTAGVANNLPLFTGGGLVDMGFGFNLGKPRSNLWLGFAGYPYDATVFSAKSDIPMTQNFILNVRTQVGFGESLEYGLALGGKVVF